MPWKPLFYGLDDIIVCDACGNVPLPLAVLHRYIWPMLKLDRHRGPLAFSLAIVALAALTGLALGGWAKHGAAMFMAMAETGLSWCF